MEDLGDNLQLGLYRLMSEIKNSKGTTEEYLWKYASNSWKTQPNQLIDVKLRSTALLIDYEDYFTDGVRSLTLDSYALILGGIAAQRAIEVSRAKNIMYSVSESMPNHEDTTKTSTATPISTAHIHTCNAARDFVKSRGTLSYCLYENMFSELIDLVSEEFGNSPAVSSFKIGLGYLLSYAADSWRQDQVRGLNSLFDLPAIERN